MELRRPAVAGSFYPRSESECRRLLESCLEGAPRGAGRAVAAIVPHAGWIFSGPTAARAFRALEATGPRTFVLLGAVHRWGVPTPALYPQGGWWTPMGPVEVDAELAAEVLRAASPELVADAEAHEGEHSLEVQVPFVRLLFPQARIVPILVPPGKDAVPLGERLGALLADRADVVCVGSTDLTHYGPRYGFTSHGTGTGALRWVREENDAAMIARMTRLEAEEVLPEFHERQNACGPGAIAATVAAARARGSREGTLLHYTTSADVKPAWGREDFVGYAAMLF